MAAGSSGISFEDSTPTSPTAPAIPEVSALTEAEASEPPKKAKSGSPDPIGAKEPSSKPASMDLFGNDDLIEGPSLKLITGTAKESSEQDDIFSKDSFGSKSAKEKAVAEDLFSSPAADTLNSGDSLLNAAPAKPESAATKSAAAKKDISSSVNNQVDDDLFKASAKAKPSKVSPVLDDDDDLFSSSSLKKGERTKDSKTENVKDSEKNKPVVDISSSKKNTPVDDEEEDIFADSSLGKKKETKQKKSTLDDDLFGSKNQDDSKKAARPRKAITNEAKLLSDTTDIFSDIPEVTAKDTKKKVTKKAPEKKTIFKDDVDDIFADTPVVTSKSKKDVKKKAVQKTPAVDTDNIFDDPLS